MFEWLSSIDWTAIGKIIGIDIMLSADNAMLIAMATAGLPLAQRARAKTWGIAGAIGARMLFLAIAGWLLLNVPIITVIGGLALLKIAYDFAVGGDPDPVEQSSLFWKAVGTIVVADVIMSIDNVVAVSGASTSAGEHAIWYSIAGIALSIPLIIWASSGITKLMEQFPIITWFGAGLLGWIGGGLIAHYFDPSFTTFASALGAVVVIAGAWVKVNFSTELKQA